MQVKGKLNNVKVTPRKMALVADMIRGMNANSAIDLLSNTNKNAARVALKLVQSVTANYLYINSAKKAELKIEEIFVTKGRVLKRGKAVSRGRFHRILRRYSNLNLVLSDNK